MLTVCEGLEEARVLIVDDEPDIRQVMRDVLQSRGAMTECVACAEEALARVQNGSYDLIWLDLRLPGMDGITVLRHILGIDPFARVVLMSAYGTFDSFVDVMALGAASMVKKPFTTEQILSVSQHAMNRR